MCGKYYIDSDMADEIEKVVYNIDQRIRKNIFREISFQQILSRLLKNQSME